MELSDTEVELIEQYRRKKIARIGATLFQQSAVNEIDKFANDHGEKDHADRNDLLWLRNKIANLNLDKVLEHM